MCTSKVRGRTCGQPAGRSSDAVVAERETDATFRGAHGNFQFVDYLYKVVWPETETKRGGRFLALARRDIPAPPFQLITAADQKTNVKK